MRIDYLSSDIRLFHGDSLAALATAFIAHDKVLLVDVLASDHDTIGMRSYLESELGLKVERIVQRHASQAQAASRLFPHAARGNEVGALQWGRHDLELFHAEGTAADAVAIDVPSADLLLVPAVTVGHIARLGESAPEQVDAALAQLQQRGRARIVPGHIGAQHGEALGHARHYLRQLGERVTRERRMHQHDAQAAIEAIAVDDCLPGGEYASPVERYWHQDNLKRIGARGLFPAEYRAQAPGVGFRSALTAMFAGLARQGV